MGIIKSVTEIREPERLFIREIRNLLDNEFKEIEYDIKMKYIFKLLMGILLLERKMTYPDVITELDELYKEMGNSIFERLLSITE